MGEVCHAIRGVGRLTERAFFTSADGRRDSPVPSSSANTRPDGSTHVYDERYDLARRCARYGERKDDGFAPAATGFGGTLAIVNQGNTAAAQRVMREVPLLCPRKHC